MRNLKPKTERQGILRKNSKNATSAKIIANAGIVEAGSRCECPDWASASDVMKDWYSKEEYSGMNHEPHQCKCTNELALYQRGDKKLWLCSCCYQFGDVRVRG